MTATPELNVILLRLDAHDSRIEQLERRVRRLSALTPHGLTVEDHALPVEAPPVAPSAPVPAQPVPADPVPAPEWTPPPPPLRPAAVPAPALVAVAAPAERPAAEAFELRLATLLPKVGGALVVLGLAFLAAVVTPRLGPLGKLAGAYALCGALVALGRVVRRRHELAGRATVATGLAVGFFASYAGHFVQALGVLPLGASLVGMAAFSAAIVWLAERWRSEATGVFGFALALLAVLASAPAAGIYAPVGVVVLALGAAALLLRNEWRALTLLALSGAYGALGLLPMLAPAVRDSGLGLAAWSLALVHLVFAAAFLRWGRRWVAFEMAAEEARGREALPEGPVEGAPFGRAFAVLNSAGLLGVALWYMSAAELSALERSPWYMAIALLECGRIALRVHRRGGLLVVHAAFALGLASAAASAGLSKGASAPALASLALGAVLAGWLVRELRWLRYLAVPVMLMAGFTALSIPGVPTLSGQALLLPTAALLLAAAWPWARTLGSRAGGAPVSIAGRLLTAASMQVAGLAGSAVLLRGMYDAASVSQAPQEWPLAAFLALALPAGAVALRARGWALGAMSCGAVFCVGVAWDFSTSAPAGALVGMLAAVTAMLGLWSLLATRAENTLERVAIVLLLLLPGLLAFIALTEIFEESAGVVAHRGLLFSAAAAAFGAAWLGVERAARWWARMDGLEAPPSTAPALLWHAGSAVLLAALALAGAVADAPRTLLDAAVLVAAFAVAAVAAPRFSARHGAMAGAAAAGAAAVTALAAGVSALGPTGAAVLPSAMLAAAAVGYGLVASRRELALTGSAVLLAQTFLLPFLRIDATAPQALTVAALGLVAGAALFARDGARGGDDRAAQGLGGLLLLFGGAAALFLLGHQPFLPGSLVTLAWGALAAGLLASGLLFLRKPLRLAALAVFACAVARLLLVDLAGLDLLAKGVAALGVGLLLVGAGVGYAYAERKLREGLPPPE
ncbi:MAG: DUF2339 domain-containing protein [Candidatus Sumerlaeia bacterium]|nr:DUF2339 domain-containing protein [Candidatus Sumerlaeia bacterium]